MMSDLVCPHCGSDNRGEPIGEQYLVHLDTCAKDIESWGRCYCLPYGDRTHFTRAMGHELMGVYDGILFWQCDDCSLAFHRWSPEHYLHKRAAKHIKSFNRAIQKLAA